MRDFAAYVRRRLSPRDARIERYDEVVEELASELEARYTALVGRGASDDEAWKVVVAQVPSWSAFAEALAAADPCARVEARPAWRRVFAIERWVQELAFGVRILRKDLGFTATAVVTLAVCLGGHAAIAAAVNAMLFHPLRAPEPDRVLLMANQYPRAEARRARYSAAPDYDDRLRHVTVFEEQAFYGFASATIESGGVPMRMRGMAATPSLFRLLRVNPVLGRVFTDAEDTPGSDARVLLTDGLWRELSGADPSIVGRTLRLSGRDRTIVGVLPPDFVFGDPAARYWVPLALTDRQRSDEARHRNGWLSIGRLKPGATIEQAQQQLAALDAANFARMPSGVQPILTNTGFYTGIEPLQDALVRDVRGPLVLLWSAAVAVLVIGIANLATIALARSRARLGDLGTRLALGASRFDVGRQLLVEGMLIAVAGVAGGLALAAWMTGALQAFAVPGVRVDAGVSAITVALGAFAGVLMALVSASPLLTERLGTLLHEGARGRTRGRVARTTWRTLVVAQMTCSFVLLMGTALLWVSVRNLLALDPGFRTDHAVTGIVSLSGPRYASDADARAFIDRSLESIRALPGVAAAGATTIVPMSGSGQTGVVMAEGYVGAPGEPAVSAVRSLVTPGYFEAVGTPLLEGRFFDAREARPESRAIVIDQRLARRFWPDGSAVGRRLVCPMTARELGTPGATARWLTVIGVVRSARLTGSLTEEGPTGTSGTYYLPYAVAAPRDAGYVIRTAIDPAAIVPDVRSALARIDRELPLFDIRTLAERTELALGSRTETLRLVMAFAGVGVFLAALGLYGMLAYLVTQRTREMGVRLALGSTPRAIAGLLLREGLWLAAAGAALGAAGSALLGRLLATHLYGIAPSDPRVMLVTAAALAVVAVLACLVPARRAARVDVMRILNAP
jgi:putative ABC transport system permease protein